MNSLIMWLGLALFIAALCLASASGAFTKHARHRSNTGAAKKPLRRLAGVLFITGIMLWIIGALLTAGAGN